MASIDLRLLVQKLEQAGYRIADYLTTPALVDAAIEARMQTKAYTETSYRAGIYDAARLYWKEGSRGNFITRMNALIKFGLNDAWNNGAQEMGVDFDEFEQADKDKIAGIITEEKSHVTDLLNFLDGLAQSGKPVDSASYRLDMWANRYPDVVGRARVWFGGKRRLRWVLGEAEHCETCLALSGIVAWAQEWEAADIRPKSQRLACHGFNCQCSLTPTTSRRSPRALARIMRIVGGG